MQNEKHLSKMPNQSDLAKTDDTTERTSRLNGAIFIVFCGILIFSTLAYGSVDTWAFGFLSILNGTIIILWLLDSFQKSRFEFDTSPLQIPLIGLIVIGLVQLLPLGDSNFSSKILSIPIVNTLSINPYATRLAVVQLIIYLSFFASALVFINSPKRLRRIVAVIIIFGAAMAFFGILQRIANPEGIYGLRPTPQAIPFSAFVNQHHFAALMEMTIGLSLALLIGRAVTKDKNIILVFAIALMGISIILTGSRGGLLSLLGVIGFVSVVSFLKRKKTDEDFSEEGKQTNLRYKLFFVGSALALIVGLFGAVILLGGDASLMRGIGFTSQIDVSSGRTHFWSVAWQIFKNYPILGAGFDAFGTAFPQYDSWNGNLRVEQAHNDYLQILADAGIAGFFCVVTFIFLLFKKGFQTIGFETDRFRLSTAIGALAGCFGILLHSFFDFPLRTSSNAFFFLIFTVLATSSIHFPKKQRRRN